MDDELWCRRSRATSTRCSSRLFSEAVERDSVDSRCRGPPLRASTDWESADGLRQALNELVRPGRLTLGSIPFGVGPLGGARAEVRPVESDLYEVLLPAVLRVSGTWLRGLPASGPPLRASTDWESADWESADWESADWESADGLPAMARRLTWPP